MAYPAGGTRRLGQAVRVQRDWLLDPDSGHGGHVGGPDCEVFVGPWAARRGAMWRDAGACKYGVRLCGPGRWRPRAQRGIWVASLVLFRAWERRQLAEFLLLVSFARS